MKSFTRAVTTRPTERAMPMGRKRRMGKVDQFLGFGGRVFKRKKPDFYLIVLEEAVWSTRLD
jgi:hypothetical protein